MDHLCHHCNATVEDGVPFCPKCGAPQIRVVGAEGDEAVTPPLPPGTPGDLQPPAQPVYPDPSAWGRVPALDGSMINWRVAFKGAAVAGVVAGILTEVPVVSLLSIFWLFLAGGMAVLMYRNRTGSQVSIKAGAKIGAFAGLFAFAITAISNTVKFILFPNLVREQLQLSMQTSIKNADPQTAKLMHDLFQNLQTPEGMVILLILMLGMLFVFLLVLTSAGGAALAAMSKRNRAI